MKKFFISFLFLTLNAGILAAQTPEWSTTIASIFYNNCTSCHHEGGIGPFSLIDYDNAVINGFTIQADVNAKKMPPWPADPDYNHFWDERVLSDAEITSINDWVNGGMPSGDLNAAPVPPVYNGASTMINPDDTVELLSYTIPSDLEDYRTFVVHSNYAVTKYLNAIEFVPGDPSIVHHANFHYDTSDISYQKDLDDTLPGFDTGGFGDPSPYAVPFGGWTPGSNIYKFAPVMGIRVLPNSDFVISIHYAPGHMGKTDSSKLFFKFCTVPDSVVREVHTQKWLFAQYPVLVNGPLNIPANEVLTFNEVSLPTAHKSLVGLNPHSHLVCKSWQVRMVTAPGDTTNLISIPQWDFNWQYSYLLTKVLEVPTGTVMLGEAEFDNTVNNPDNPNDPPLGVHEGGHSDDEMMTCGFLVMNYEPGDENIILDSAFYGFPTSDVALEGNLALNIYPNPANDAFHIISDLPAHNVNWQLTDLFGVMVRSMNLKNVAKGVYIEDVDVSQLPAGIYQLSIQSGGVMAVKKLTLVR